MPAVDHRRLDQETAVGRNDQIPEPKEKGDVAQYSAVLFSTATACATEAYAYRVRFSGLPESSDDRRRSYPRGWRKRPRQPTRTAWLLRSRSSWIWHWNCEHGIRGRSLAS